MADRPRVRSLTRGYRVVRPLRGRQPHPHRQPHPPPQSGAPLWGRQPHPHRQPHPPPQSGTPTAGPAASPAPAASSAATEWYALRGVSSITHTGSLIRRHRVVRPLRGRQHHPHRQPHPPPQSGATSAGSAASPHRQPHPPPQSSAPPSGPAASPAHRRQHPHRLLPCTTPLPASITQAPVPDGHAAEMTAAKRSNYSITAGEPRANPRTG